ncbi:MAG: hypothetical protein IKL68_00475 [Clostridia bacterium]|nr:hypothetical protein [Clostridia bacterium]
MKNEKKVKVKEATKKKLEKKSSVFSKISIVILIALIILMCVVVYCVVQSFKYKSYTDKMYYYGYNEFYSNKKATAYKKLSNLDMFKVLIGSINNASDLDKLALVNKTEDMTDDDVWYETARLMNLALRIEKEDANKKATTIDAVITAMRVLEASLNINIEESTLNMSENKLNKFIDSDRKYIAKAVTLGIIENNDSSLRKNKMIRGELNKLVIEICSKYATVYYKSQYVNEEGKLVKNDAYLVTDEANLPTNSEEYPYIINKVTKNEYEMPLIIENERDYMSPKEVFEDMGDLYGQIDNVVTGYLDKVLNVDYNTINYIKFYKDLNRYSIYNLDKDMVEMYTEYVIDNKIILKGNVEMLLPILYYTGERYCVRAKVTMQVVNSNTNKDLLFADTGNDIEYNGKEITMYVDIPLSMTINSKSLYVEPVCLARRLVSKTDDVKVPKIGGVIYEENK